MLKYPCHSSRKDENLDWQVFYSVREAKVVVEDWRLEYNNHRPHSSLGYMTPAEFSADNSLIKVGK
ncbi:MAG: integrase core domain-containing protein [Planctomycetota bacterium]